MLFFVSGLLLFFLCVYPDLGVAGNQSPPGVCWETVKVPRVRGKLESVPTEERYLDYDCYLRTYHAYDCYKTRRSFRYEYVTEDYFAEEQVKVCCEGYQDSNGQCLPMCEKECIFGSCVSPNTCECSSGYVVVDASNPNVCEPHCDECVNGVCSAPNVCDCQEGYEHSSHDNFCIPACNPPCVNGQCIQPNMCSCLSGYERRNQTECTPVCTLPCQGICTAPEICTCNEDHYQINNTHCQPRCDPPCNNGVCLAPQTCVCLDHYEKVDNFTCRPTCEAPCINSHCTDVNQCTCNPGYAQVNASYCTPVCSSPCINGECVSPDRCYCSTGFQYVNESYCEPYCENCRHGTCTAPHVCECEHGYLYNNVTSSCERICAEVCTNGTCISNKCFCQEGDMNPFCIIPCNDNYSLNQRTRRCDPQCYNCTHGYCSVPNVCSCPYNHHLEQNTCVVNAQFYMVYIILLDLFTKQDLFLSCRSELMKSGPVKSIAIATWSLDTYELVSCNFEARDSGNSSCEVECDLELVNSSTGGPPIVSVKCSLYNNRTYSVNYGSIECIASSIEQAATSPSTLPSSTTDWSTLSGLLSVTASFNQESSTITSTPEVVTNIYSSEPTDKILYECLNTTIDPASLLDRTTSVFLRYFIERKIVDQIRRNQQNEISGNQTEALNSSSNRFSVESTAIQLNGTSEALVKGVQIKTDSIENKERKTDMTSSCPVLCPSQQLTTTLLLIDGTHIQAPVASCFEDQATPTASASISSIVKVASYVCTAALSCILLVAIAVRYWMARRRVFFVKGRSCGDGATEEETDEVFRLAGSSSEVYSN